MVDAMSGANDFAVALCQALAVMCELSVFTVENSRLDESRDKLRVIRAWPQFFGTGSRLSKLRKLVVAIESLLRELWRHRHATVHSQFPRFYLIELMVFVLARPFLNRLVITAHNAVPHERSRWREMLLHLWYRLPDSIVVLSENVRGEIIGRFGIPPGRIVVIPHGSYVAFRQSCEDLVPSESVAKAIEDLRDELLIFQFGIIREYKGIDALISAARQLSGASAWRILVAGGGSTSLVEHYRAQIRDHGLESRFSILHAFLPDKDLSALIERADILVFPYRGISQSGALLMGMSYGKPCVCTDLPGFREYLRNGEAIFIGELRAEMDLSCVLSQLMSDQGLRQRLGQAVLRAVNDRYSWNNLAASYCKVYFPAEDAR